ncbi:phosphoglucosamine mutase [Sulfuriflexus sp.]|uniref:phosphoglucosamine mutase n=1 Tax=Sulfuriflexus sp. TaxID=2015443 RepID=UPI0028CE7B38|nr:phosphoglucosamine mutase [Sulfuriflexus sp.]MDT8403073.1 phosphoglucosamine mutase [Sulfuriflexus sp.]
MTRRYFGTDGVRGRVGIEPVTPAFIMRLGWAAGRVLANGGNNTVLIGKDTRISGYMFESALEAGLSAAGVNIRLLGPMPTPAIAYLTRTFHANAGIVISASHNPFYDNGIKFFSADGTKLPDEVELAIEAELDKPMTTVDSAKLGKASRVVDASGRYIEFCKSTIPLSMNFKGMRLVIDCAHGATYHVAPSVFAELGAEVITIGAEPDGLNINEGFGSTRPQALQAAVLANQADVGIALDGDGDRLIMVDAEGELVDGDQILYIIAVSRLREGTLNGTVVGTVMSNLGLEHALNEKGIDFKRAGVGDRYVMDMLRQGGWAIGGESSGHIICLDRTTTGDGTVAALQVLGAMQTTGKSLAQLAAGMHQYPQTLLNVPVNSDFNLAQASEVQAVMESAKEQLADTGRILLRASGTEPLLRVMVEGQDAELVDRLAGELATAVREAAAQTARVATAG